MKRIRDTMLARRFWGTEVSHLDTRTRLHSFADRPPHVEPVGKTAWLVQKAAAPRRRLKVRAVDERTWVLSRGGARTRQLRRIGPRQLGTTLLLDRAAVRKNMRAHQMGLLSYVAEEHIAWLLRELEINCVLDVGANIGQYGKRLRKAGYAGRIVSFEPLAQFADQLETAAAGDDEWHVVRCALGQRHEEADMTIASGMGRMSSLLSPSTFGRSWSSNIEGVGSESVSIRRLDGLLAEVTRGIATPRIYLKLDTQGYDLEAFAGAGGCISQIVGMQSEVSSVPIYDNMPRLTEQLATYESAGFELTGMFPVSVDRPTMRVIEFDAVLVRADALVQR